MRLPYSIPEARTNILQQGIQQTNRYAVYYSGDGIFKYPYAVTLPGYGYDLIDHSLWALNRKIPFRRSNTDVELTFIVGNTNYLDYVYYWNNLLSSPKSNPTAVLSDPGDIANFAQANGISSSEFEEVSNTGARTETPTEPEGGSIEISGNGDIFGSPWNNPAITVGQNILESNGTTIVNGQGGAASYMDKIYKNYLAVSLLAENHQVRNTFIFEEAYISQVSEVQLTSTETGYSPFKVSFRFTTMRTEV